LEILEINDGEVSNTMPQVIYKDHYGNGNALAIFTRHLLRFFDFLAHPKLRATLATDKK
jgi:hypothetical protein